MSKFWSFFAPDLAKFRPVEQVKALATAKNSELKSAEVAVMVVWLVVVVFITKALIGTPAQEDVLSYTIVVNLFVTAPLLLAVYAPIHVRRVRRGLTKLLEDKFR